MTPPVTAENIAKIIAKKIFLIRGQRVMLSTHLAKIYGIKAKVFVQAVKRNIERFPQDFMFQLSVTEYKNLKSQFVTSSWGGIRRARPYAFTEQGVAMLSSVLKSKRAIQVNIVIMRTFVKLKEVFSAHKELAHKLSQLERKIEKHDVEIQTIFEAIRQLMTVPENHKRNVGQNENFSCASCN